MASGFDGLAPYRRLASLADRYVPDWVAPLITRLGVAAVFFMSGRTKVDGLLHIKDSTYFLFETDYKLPFVPPVIAAHAAAYSEHLFPILLVLGLFTRVGAAGLLVMTVVIQFFVYPDAWWQTHIVWVALAGILVVRGGGMFSVDRLIGHKFG